MDLKQVRSCDADGYLVRNYDHLAYFAADRKRGDFSLNVANPLTAAHYLRRHGLERVTASYDLNITQLESLLQGAPGTWFDITIHQHMPMFHMEHCVFCAFLSKGKDYHDCGRPVTPTASPSATASAPNSRSRPTPAAATPSTTTAPKPAPNYVARISRARRPQLSRRIHQRRR